MAKDEKRRQRSGAVHKSKKEKEKRKNKERKKGVKDKKDRKKEKTENKGKGNKENKAVGKNKKLKISSSKKSGTVKEVSASKKKSSPKKSSARKKQSSLRVLGHRRPKRKSIQGITKIKVIGVGGAGGNIITRMREKSRIRGVEYIAVNTDVQDLEGVSAHKKIQIGKALTKGMGAGMNPDIGRQAVEESRSEIGEVLKGADIVFVTAGFGGGTGGGAAPVIAEIAKQEGILTIGIVTKPFKFEGSKRMMLAQEGIDRIRGNVDALVVVPNDRIFSVIDKDTPILKAFAYVDDILRDGVEAIADLINVPGIINVDFSDIKTILQDMGTSMIGVGVARGQDRSRKVVQQAINSPLLETSIEGAKGVLFSIAGGRDLKMSEVNEIAKAISDSSDPNAQIIFGATSDSSLKDKAIKLTVIATGFNGMMREAGSFNIPHLFAHEDKKRRDDFEIDSSQMGEDVGEMEKEEGVEGVVEETDEEGKKDSKFGPWDIPTFLRRKKK